MTSFLDPITPDQWTPRAARHLLSRAGFGVPLTDIERLHKLGAEAAVDELLNYEKFPEVLAEPDWMEKPGSERAMRQQIAALEKMNYSDRVPTDEERQKMEEERRKLFNQLQAKEREDTQRLKLWWLRRMAYTRRPLQEKMTLFWHGHFATSAEKVKSAWENYQLNKLFRDMATGNFKKLTYEVGVSPAMMRYLDNDQNNKRHPNENWARELMELFTLGKGNYTEDDIKNSARAFTGWTSDGEKFVYNPGLHDDDEKVFFGRKGNFNGNDIIDMIFDNAASQRFISRKLWLFFAYDDPEPEVVEGLAKTLRAKIFEIKPTLRQLFLSRAFYSEKAVGTQIKSPTQLAISMASALEVRPQPESMVERYLVASLRSMGQDLLYPPNVKGWDGGKAWINTNTLMTRYNLAGFLTQGVATNVGPGTGMQQILAKAKRKLPAGKPKSREEARLNQAKLEMEMASAKEGGGQTMMMEGGDSEMGGMEMDFSSVDPRDLGVIGDSNGPKGVRLPMQPFDAVAFFARADKIKFGELIDFLADYFYGRPVTDQQKGRILDAFGGVSPDSVFEVKAYEPDRLRGVVRLMLSAAEFQLC